MKNLRQHKKTYLIYLIVLVSLFLSINFSRAAEEPNWGSDANISQWTQSISLNSVTFNGDEICLNYTNDTLSPVQYGTIQITGNFWIVVNQGGQLYASTWDYVRPNQTCKDISNISGRSSGQGGALNNSALNSFVPVFGTSYGFIFSGVARSGAGVSNQQIKSNIFWA